MHTVELLLDAELEADVRGVWDRLHAAGLPSLATHRHPTNRPHVTLVAAESLAGLPPLDLPAPVELGGVRMLGRALVREVVRTPELVVAHERLWQAVGSANPLHAPAGWVPHVSLALRMPEDAAPTALAFLADLPPGRGRFVAARSYDTETRVVTTLSGAGEGRRE